METFHLYMRKIIIQLHVKLLLLSTGKLFPLWRIYNFIRQKMKYEYEPEVSLSLTLSLFLFFLFDNLRGKYTRSVSITFCYRCLNWFNECIQYVGQENIAHSEEIKRTLLHSRELQKEERVVLFYSASSQDTFCSTETISRNIELR